MRVRQLRRVAAHTARTRVCARSAVNNLHNRGHDGNRGFGWPFAALAQREGVSRSYFTLVARLGYLPHITQAILDRRQPDLTTEELLEHSRLPLAWHDQRTQPGRAVCCRPRPHRPADGAPGCDGARTGFGLLRCHRGGAARRSARRCLALNGGDPPAVDKARKSGSQLTHHWREADSNHRSGVTPTKLSMSPLVGFPPTEKSERRRTVTRSVEPFPAEPMVRIRFPPAERCYGAGGEDGNFVAASTDGVPRCPSRTT
jgi:hypothetical protein